MLFAWFRSRASTFQTQQGFNPSDAQSIVRLCYYPHCVSYLMCDYCKSVMIAKNVELL